MVDVLLWAVVGLLLLVIVLTWLLASAKIRHKHNARYWEAMLQKKTDSLDRAQRQLAYYDKLFTEQERDQTRHVRTE